MRVLRSALSLLAMALLAINVSAQTGLQENVYNFSKSLPSSPGVAMLSRFGDIPVGHYTGIADVSIPLYAIKIGGTSIPIVLRYHGGGNRVEDFGSEVGLGWMLDPGGAVVQEIRGKEDLDDELVNSYGEASYNKFMNNNPIQTQYGTYLARYAFPCWQNYDPELYGQMQKVLQGSGEPDIYSFSFPGGNGKFILDRVTRQPILLDKRRFASITYRYAGQWQAGWIITDVSGNKYVYGSKEDATTIPTTDATGHSWKLDAIGFANGDYMTYSYKDGSYLWYSYSEAYHTPFPVEPTAPFIDKKLTSTRGKTKTLVEIHTEKETVVFNLEDRIDMGAESDNDGNSNNGTLSTKRFKSVDIIDNETGKKIKSFAFTYDYFTSTWGPTYAYANTNINDDALSKRLKLKAVKEIGYDKAGEPVEQLPYKFEYDESVLMPGKTGMNRDYWGFCNGSTTGNTLIPDIRYLLYTGYYGTQAFNINESDLNFAQWGNRAADTSKVSAYLLKKLTYPTGGYSTFSYESNSFSNYELPDANKLVNTQKAISVNDQNMSYNVKSQNFTLARNVPLTMKVIITSGRPENLYMNSPVRFMNMVESYVDIYANLSTGSELAFHYQMDINDQPDFDVTRNKEKNIQVNLSKYPVGTVFTIRVEMPDDLGEQFDPYKMAGIAADINYYEVPVSSSGNIVSYGGGSRIKNISHFTDDGKLSHSKTYRYVKEDGKTSGLLMSRILFVYDRPMTFFENSWLNGGVVYTNQVNQVSWFFSSQSVIPTSTAAGGNLVGYSRVEEIDTDGEGNSLGKKVLTFYNLESNTSPERPDIPNPLNGNVQTESYFDNAGNMLTYDDYYYDATIQVLASGVKAQYNAVMTQGCANGGMTVPANIYVCLFYPIKSIDTRLTKKISKKFANNVTAVTTEEYGYNARNLLTKRSLTDSKNDLNILSTVFAPDGNGTDNSLLVSKEIYDRPLQITSSLNSVPVEDLRYTYKLDGDFVRSNTVNRVFNNSGKTINEVTFDKYNRLGEPTQVTQKGVQNAILFNNFETYAIATAVNANLSQVAATSFEWDADGNWPVESSSVSTDVKLTGNCSYNIGTGPMSISGFSSQPGMIVSYWTTAANPISVTGTIKTTKGTTAGQWTYYEHEISSQATVTVSGTGYIDDLRLYPKTAQVTTYTMQPGIGVTSKCDVSGVPQFFEYDAFGRLSVIKDKDGNIIKAFRYKYGDNGL